MTDRWATFDCYGTLVDWDEGIRRELERLFGAERAPRLLRRYHELERQLQAGSHRSYREVMAAALARLAEAEGVALPCAETNALADSLPDWPVFPEVPEALARARGQGWKLAVLSNSDRDLIAASCERIGVPFELTVVAQDVGSYKPGHRHWHRFFEQTGASTDRHVHVAASVFHDIVPARELALTCVWINRLNEPSEVAATRELPDLRLLPRTLEELLPTEF